LSFSSKESEKILTSSMGDKYSSIGAYLTRFSSEPGCFGLSCVVEDKELVSKVIHLRVKYIPGSGFEFGQKIYASFADFENAVKASYSLTKIVPSHHLGSDQTFGYVETLK
jgi:hypothetical protein